MLVSTKGRYALRVIVDLAEHASEGRIPLRQIADRQGISEKYLENILSTLVRHGILSGLRGKGGGYCLTREPDQFTVGEVLRLSRGLAFSRVVSERRSQHLRARGYLPHDSCVEGTRSSHRGLSGGRDHSRSDVRSSGGGRIAGRLP